MVIAVDGDSQEDVASVTVRLRVVLHELACHAVDLHAQLASWRDDDYASAVPGHKLRLTQKLHSRDQESQSLARAWERLNQRTATQGVAAPAGIDSTVGLLLDQMQHEVGRLADNRYNGRRPVHAPGPVTYGPLGLGSFCMHRSCRPRGSLHIEQNVCDGFPLQQPSRQGGWVVCSVHAGGEKGRSTSLQTCTRCTEDIAAREEVRDGSGLDLCHLLEAHFLYSSCRHLRQLQCVEGGVTHDAINLVLLPLHRCFFKLHLALLLLAQKASSEEACGADALILPSFNCLPGLVP